MQGRRSARARQGEVNEVAGLGVAPHAGADGIRGLAALGGPGLGRDRDRRVPALGGHDARTRPGRGRLLAAARGTGHPRAHRRRAPDHVAMGDPGSHRDGRGRCPSRCGHLVPVRRMVGDAAGARRVHGASRHLLVDVAARPAPHARRGPGRAPDSPGRGQHRGGGHGTADRLRTLAPPEHPDGTARGAGGVDLVRGSRCDVGGRRRPGARPAGGGPPRSEHQRGPGRSCRGSPPASVRPTTRAWCASTSPGWTPAPATTTRRRSAASWSRSARGSCAPSRTRPPASPSPSATAPASGATRPRSTASARPARTCCSTSATSPTWTSGPTTGQRCAACTTRS